MINLLNGQLFSFHLFHWMDIITKKTNNYDNGEENNMSFSNQQIMVK